MSLSRTGPKGARLAPFGLSLFCCALAPTQIGYQDIAALLARQPGVAARYQQHVTSAFGAMRIATFSFPRPLGTEIAQTANYQLASLEARGVDVTGSVARNPLGAVLDQPHAAMQFPVVDRTLKGDRLVPPSVPIPASAPATREPQKRSPTIPTAREQAEPLDPELEAALKAEPFPRYDLSMSFEARPQIAPPEAFGVALAEPDAIDLTSFEDSKILERDKFSVATEELFFGSGSLGFAHESLKRWRPGEEPLLVPAPADPDLKRTASLPAAARPGESVAGKGEVTDGPHPKSPAERLGLEGKARAKAEKCLADAVYFEARGEQVRGQMAVAQVVMNRVFSGFYPTTVCGVVYQNAHRHLSCQFTFACDGAPEAVNEPDAWERAKKIAKATLDGRIWLPEVAKSTHYHAYWVRPSWVREMRRLHKLGVHTFYRPRAWGDGGDAPIWGTAAAAAEMASKL